ncbi:MAG: hypothetical protein J6X18_13475 [Bacteroidales bacterium]|nr:hypothetical protein [Bacteroidales bacterium]
MKNLLLVLFTHIVATQALFAQLEIETTVPTGFDEAINVGVGTGHFETIVKNKSGVETVTGIKVTPLGGLDGLEILANATYEYNGTVYSASVTGDLIQTNGSMRLMAGEQIKFLYEKRAKCSIVPQASSGYSMQVVDDISVLGTDYSEQTNSYPVLFPGLSVIVPESPLNNKQVEYHENFSDEVSIKNEQNSGKVNSLIIRMDYNRQVISVNKIEIQGSAGTIERNISSNNVAIRLESSDLESLGFENGIMPANSQFKVVSYGRVEEYSATTQVKYSVDYVAFNETCQRLKNAEGIMYFQQNYPNPQLSNTSNVLSNGTFCGEKFIVEYLIESINIQNPSNYLLNMYLNTSFVHGFTIDAIYCNDIPLDIRGSYHYLFGLGSIDKNSINADYKGDEPIRIKFIATPYYSTNYFYYNFFVRLEGEKISGDSFIMPLDEGVIERRDCSSYVTGDATIDNVSKRIGHYQYDYNVQLEKRGFDVLNYDLFIKEPNGTLKTPVEGTAVGWQTTYNGHDSGTITACEDENPIFQIVAMTENCTENVVVLTEAAPTVVQRCYESADGCYEGNVTEAYFVDKKEINTCDEVSIQAKGTIAYSCKSDCPKFKSVAVSIEDLSGRLPIEISNPLLDGIQSAQTLEYRDGIKAYEFPITMEECPDEDAIVRKELNFSGNLFVKDHINANRVDANIQVRYILVESSADSENILHDDTWTWGDMLTVYDPKPTFSMYSMLSGCDTRQVIVEMGKGTETGNPASIKVTEVDFPAQPDFYYAPNGFRNTNMPYTIDSQWTISQTQKRTKSVDLIPKCAEDGKLSSELLGYIYYEDFYGTTCQTTVKDTIKISPTTYKMPQITLIPTERQQSVESTTTWTLLVENTGHSTARSVMLRLTPNEGNSMMINIGEIRINGQICYDIRRRGGSVYVPMPSNFLKSSQKVVTITASYEECTDDGISTIDVESAWSCEELTENNFDDFNCGGTAVLELENMVAVLSAIETYPKEYFHFCDDIPIHLDISNIGRADLSRLGFWFDKFPNTYTLTDNSIHWVYNGKNGIITDGYMIQSGTQNIKINLRHENAYISVMALGLGTIADTLSEFHSASNLELDFKTQMHCDGEGNRINALNFSIGGYTNCQAQQIREFQFKPKFEEFKYLDSLSVQATVDNKNFEYGGIRDFTAIVQNLSNALVDSAYVTVTYPNDLQYIGYDAIRSIGVVDEEIIDNNDGTTTVEWKLQEGIH